MNFITKLLPTLSMQLIRTVKVGVGDIRNKKLHKSSVIVNVDNIQIDFRSGVSGAISEQVGDKTKIEAKTQELIAKFNA